MPFVLLFGPDDLVILRHTTLRDIVYVDVMSTVPQTNL